MFNFGLRSTSDHRLSNLSKKCQPKCKKMKKPPYHQKIKCSILDYVQLLMIGQVIQATKVNWNAKKGPLSHQKMKCSVLDYAQLLMISEAIGAMKVNQPIQNGQFRMIRNSSNLFSLKWLRMTWNGQFYPVHNFSNFFPPKWLRMTRNG